MLGTIATMIAVKLAFWAAFIAVMYLVFAGWRRLTGKTRPPRTAGGSDASRLRGRMKRMTQRTLLMTPAQSPAFSQLGGSPQLPQLFDWPAGEKGPRTFLCQLSLSEVHAAGGPEWLPSTGRLYFFYDDWRRGLADLVHVIHQPDEDASTNGLGPGAFVARPVTFQPKTSLPSLDWLGVDPAELDCGDDELDELAELPEREFGTDPQHRIGGYPGEIQDEQMGLSCEYFARGMNPYKNPEATPAIERASKAWRLLLQVDSDKSLKMNWGDGGRLYVFIREKHAIAGDFSKTITLWQTH